MAHSNWPVESSDEHIDIFDQGIYKHSICCFQVLDNQHQFHRNFQLYKF